MTTEKSNFISDKNKNSKFYELYGFAIAKEGIAPIPVALFRYQRALGLSFQEVSFICHLLSYRWTVSDPYPSIEKLSELTGISAKTLHAYKKSLIQKGKIKVYNRFDHKGGQLTNGYDLTPLFKDLEELISQKEGCEEITYPPITPSSQGGITTCSHELDPIQLDNVVVEQPNVIINHLTNHLDENNAISKKTSDYRENNLISKTMDKAYDLQSFAKEISGTDIPVDFFKSLLEKYPEVKIIEKLRLIQNAEIKNIPGWIIAALKSDYNLKPKTNISKTIFALKEGRKNRISNFNSATNEKTNKKKELIKSLYAN